MCSRFQAGVALDSFAVEFWGWVVLYSIVFSSMMLFKRSFGLTSSLFILFVHEHDRLGFGMLTVETAVIGPLRDPVTWCRINYSGTQMTQWDFQNKGILTSPAWLFFVLKVSLRHLRPSVIYSAPCDRILQRAYSKTDQYKRWTADYGLRTGYKTRAQV